MTDLHRSIAHDRSGVRADAPTGAGRTWASGRSRGAVLEVFARAHQQFSYRP